MSAQETIEIASHQYPAVPAGVYRLEAAIANELTDTEPGGIADPQRYNARGNYREVTTFTVGGYTHHIPLQEIIATYPLRESKGNYAGVYPHIEFRRSTLPWEYLRYAGKAVPENRLPYLFLLLLKEAELGSNGIELVNGKAASLPGSLGQEAGMQLLVVPAASFHLLPDLNALKALAHVRIRSAGQDAQTPDLPQQTSLLMSGRKVMPDTPYRAFVCMYVEQDGSAYRMPEVQTALSGRAAYLVSLYDWTFASVSAASFRLSEQKLHGYPGLSFGNLQVQEHPVLPTVEALTAYLEENMANGRLLVGEGYKTLLKQLRNQPSAGLIDLLKYEGKTLKGLLQGLSVLPVGSFLPAGQEPAIAADRLLQAGKVPLPHYARAGDRLLSWYQGPFVHAQAVFSFLEFATGGATDGSFRLGQYLPDHADKLILFNRDTGMLDMGYAAAWQLGRLLLLGNNKVLQELRKWKAALALSRLVAEQNRATHLLKVKTDQSVQQLPVAVRDFVMAILKLENFPVHYLFPRKDCLPAESARYFRVDNAWMLSLLQGIFSAGPALSVQDFKETVLLDPVICTVFDYRKAYYGFALQSQVLAGWPNLRLELRRQTGEAALPFVYITPLGSTCRVYLTEHPFDQVRLYQLNAHAYFCDPEGDNSQEILAFKTVGSCIVPSGRSENSFPWDFLARQPRVDFNLKH